MTLSGRQRRWVARYQTLSAVGRGSRPADARSSAGWDLGERSCPRTSRQVDSEQAGHSQLLGEAHNGIILPQGLGQSDSLVMPKRETERSPTQSSFWPPRERAGRLPLGCGKFCCNRPTATRPLRLQAAVPLLKIAHPPGMSPATLGTTKYSPSGQVKDVDAACMAW